MEKVGFDSSPLLDSDSESDLEFEFISGPLVSGTTALPTADELFESGVIRPLKPHLYPKSFEVTKDPNPTPTPRNPITTSTSNSRVSEFSRLKRRFKDCFLFRSFSEGRTRVSSAVLACIATDYDKNSSFRSTAQDGKSLSRRRSSPELHYYRSISDLDKKKTSLPYKHGLLGCMGLTPPGFRD